MPLGEGVGWGLRGQLRRGIGSVWGGCGQCREHLLPYQSPGAHLCGLIQLIESGWLGSGFLFYMVLGYGLCVGELSDIMRSPFVGVLGQVVF